MLMNTYFLFYFNDPAPTYIYTLSLHDALPILHEVLPHRVLVIHGVERHHALHVRGRQPQHLGHLRHVAIGNPAARLLHEPQDRKSTRLNSSHQIISYAVFCLKKKKIAMTIQTE